MSSSSLPQNQHWNSTLVTSNNNANATMILGQEHSHQSSTLCSSSCPSILLPYPDTSSSAAPPNMCSSSSTTNNANANSTTAPHPTMPTSATSTPTTTATPTAASTTQALMVSFLNLCHFATELHNEWLPDHVWTDHLQRWYGDDFASLSVHRLNAILAQQAVVVSVRTTHDPPAPPHDNHHPAGAPPTTTPSVISLLRFGVVGEPLPPDLTAGCEKIYRYSVKFPVASIHNKKKNDNKNQVDDVAAAVLLDDDNAMYQTNPTKKTKRIYFYYVASSCTRARRRNPTILSDLRKYCATCIPPPIPRLLSTSPRVWYGVWQTWSFCPTMMGVDWIVLPPPRNNTNTKQQQPALSKTTTTTTKRGQEVGSDKPPQKPTTAAAAASPASQQLAPPPRRQPLGILRSDNNQQSQRIIKTTVKEPCSSLASPITTKNNSRATDNTMIDADFLLQVFDNYNREHAVAAAPATLAYLKEEESKNRHLVVVPNTKKKRALSCTTTTTTMPASSPQHKKKTNTNEGTALVIRDASPPPPTATTLVQWEDYWTSDQAQMLFCPPPGESVRDAIVRRRDRLAAALADPSCQVHRDALTHWRTNDNESSEDWMIFLPEARDLVEVDSWWRTKCRLLHSLCNVILEHMPTWQNLEHCCLRVLMRAPLLLGLSSSYPPPGLANFRQWHTAFCRSDGKVVRAFFHNMMPKNEEPQLQPQPQPGRVVI